MLYQMKQHETELNKDFINPAAGSPTATLLRLHTIHSSYIRLLFQWKNHKFLSMKNIIFSLERETSYTINLQCVTGGEYKAQVHIHRGVLIHDY